MTRLIQFTAANGAVGVGVVTDEGQVSPLQWRGTLYELAGRAIAEGVGLQALVASLATQAPIAYQPLLRQHQVLAPIHHPDPAHMIVSGTGLTHLSSAATRASMHALNTGKTQELTDSMRMYRMGLEGGKPEAGAVGVQPEWFYKGDGDIVVPPEGELTAPAYGLDLGDEAEIVGVYLIGENRTPYRIGFALGNEYSDHKMEKINYLYLAHSKLRPCSFGPEIRLGGLPEKVDGVSRVYRQGSIAWEKPFHSGEGNMSHSIANLEHHHFKYAGFLRPGDVHIHFFGTGTLSFSDQFEAREGDVFELSSSCFGAPLRNTLRQAKAKPVQPVRAL